MSMSKYRFKGASAGFAGQSFPLDDELWLGSADDCQVVVKDEGIASRHVRIYLTDGQVTAQNQAATDGELWVNGEAIVQQALASGDELRLGSARLVFQAPGLRPSSVLREEAPTRTPWGWIIGGVVAAGLAAAGAAYYFGYFDALLKSGM